MLPGFQQYLVNKGFKRTCKEHCGKNEVENYTSTFLSDFNPLHYDFRKDGKHCYWGLCEGDKPPVMYLGYDKMFIIQNRANYRTQEDGYRILFSQWKDDRFNEIFDVFMSDKKYFQINCQDETNITIEVLDK